MIVFNKNPLVDGVVRNLNEYSQDLEDRIYSGFEDVSEELLAQALFDKIKDHFGDYVVEEGEGYKKWNSGLIEQWGNVSADSVANVATLTTVNLPVPIVGSYISILVSAHSGGHIPMFVKLAIQMQPQLLFKWQYIELIIQSQQCRGDIKQDGNKTQS